MIMRRTAGDVLGACSTAEARLLAQCELHRMEAELLFDRICLECGWHALDMCCGPLGVLDILAERIGQSGSVVGLDRDPRMLEAAALSLAQRGVSGVQLVQGEVTATGLPGASFDLVHERLLLGDVVCPENVVTEMVRLVRPGGFVALQDADVISWTCEPASPAWDHLANALTTTCIGDPHVGRRLPGMLRAAGLVDVEVDVQAGLWRPGEPHHNLLPCLVNLHRDRILANGPLTEPELDACLRDVEDHLARPDTIVLSWMLFQAWGRKPFTI